MPTLKITDISLGELSFGRPSPGYMGGQFVSIPGNIVFQTPKMETGGTYEWGTGASTKKYWYLLITDPVVDDFFRRLEERVLEEAIRESVTWFGGTYEPDVIESWFTRCLYGEDPRRLRFLVPSRGIDFFDAQNAMLAYEDLPMSGPVAAIVTLEGIWFRNRSFGIGLKLNQVKYYPNDEPPPKMFAFLEDDES